MKRILRNILSLSLALGLCAGASAHEDTLERALELYHGGLYAQAMDMLQSSPRYGEDPMVDGYAALCAIRQKVSGYEVMVDNYLEKYRSSSLCEDLRLQKAYDYFDKVAYAESYEMFCSVNRRHVPKVELAEFVFKQGYSLYKTQGPQSEAVFLFKEVDGMPLNDYSASAQYCLGYIRYLQHNIDEAQSWFEKAAIDERYASICNYYIIICRYEQKDYDFILDKGVAMYDDHKIPMDRKQHLARLISEAYLVRGDKARAMEFYNQSDDGGAKSRADYFFAGSLMYATQDYKGAIRNFDMMSAKTDSLGQIALYQTALSYLGLKNKVAATGVFKAASELTYDKTITEDAMFNYAKLSFDVNGDTKPFSSYLAAYSDKVRGEKIYSYMALAALQDKDYSAAIDYYDRIDELDDVQKNNYVHANYLLGAQMLEKGSYRNAVQCMEAVAYYMPEYDVLNQLARYNLGEAYYRNGRFADAQKQFHSLYNESALVGMNYNKVLAYNIGYTYYKMEDYSNAARWFGNYVSAYSDSQYGTDALIRQGDCHFLLQDYKEASEVYEQASSRVDVTTDVYPVYQAALSYGLAKNVDKKLSLLQAVKSAQPSAPYYQEALFELGKTQAGKKKNAEATESFKLLYETALDTGFKAKALLELGSICRQKKEYDASLDYYKQVVADYRGTEYSDDAMLAIESVYKSRNKVGEYLKYLDSIGDGATKNEADRQEMIFKNAEQIFYNDDYPKALAALREFQNDYPQSPRVVEADYYIAECYLKMGDKVMASDAYAVVMGKAEADAGLARKATLNYARLNFELGNYADAYKAFVALDADTDYAVLTEVRSGAMRSAYRIKEYEDAIVAADKIISDLSAAPVLVREASMTKAKSLIATSRRDEAFAVLGPLAADPASDEGAEAAYLCIQDAYDKGDFDKVSEAVQAMVSGKARNRYYIAKAFIVLGDSYADQGNMKQAAATFESVLKAYNVTDDGIHADVQMRLDRIKQME